MHSVLYFWLGLGLGLVDVALTLASCTYGLLNIPVCCIVNTVYRAVVAPAERDGIV